MIKQVVVTPKTQTERNRTQQAYVQWANVLKKRVEKWMVMSISGAGADDERLGVPE